jgi:predicted PurR-regulated permease PerM
MVLVAAVFLPLARALFLGAVLASVLWPLHRRLCALFRGRKKLAAALVTFIVVVALVGPFVGLGAFVISEGPDAARFVTTSLHSEQVESFISRLPDSVERIVRHGLEQIPSGDSTPVAVERLTASLSATVSATGWLLFHVTMMLIAFFFFLVSKDDILSFIESNSPLRRGEAMQLLGDMRSVSSAVVNSEFLTAFAQALMALIGYFIASVPHPVIFALVTFVFAPIPAVGAGGVCVAAALLLLATGHWGFAIFLGLWGIVIVGILDNILRPLMVRWFGKVEGMPGSVIFFSFLGGLIAFGAVGLLLGPLAVALFVASLRIYRSNSVRSDEPASPPVSAETPQLTKGSTR